MKVLVGGFICPKSSAEDKSPLSSKQVETPMFEFSGKSEPDAQVGGLKKLETLYGIVTSVLKFDNLLGTIKDGKSIMMPNKR